MKLIDQISKNLIPIVLSKQKNSTLTKSKIMQKNQQEEDTTVLEKIVKIKLPKGLLRNL